MKLLIISDTHGEMPLDINKINFDAVIHAGDIGSPAFFRNLDASAGEKNLFAVYGNTDFLLCEYLPETLAPQIGSARFFIVHNLTAPHRILPENENLMQKNNSEIVVFGHTHIPAVLERYGRIYINPGALGKVGLTGYRTFAIVETDESGNVSAQIFDVDAKNILISKRFNKINGLFKEI